MINIYLLSLAFADLICGIVIVPLSIYPALQSSKLADNLIDTVIELIRFSLAADYESNWLYGEGFSDILCRITGYIEVTLFSITVSSLSTLDNRPANKIFFSLHRKGLHVHVDIRRQVFSSP